MKSGVGVKEASVVEGAIGCNRHLAKRDATAGAGSQRAGQGRGVTQQVEAAPFGLPLASIVRYASSFAFLRTASLEAPQCWR